MPCSGQKCQPKLVVWDSLFQILQQPGGSRITLLSMSSLQVSVLNQNYDGVLDVAVLLSLFFILKLVCKSKKVLLTLLHKKLHLKPCKDTLASRNLWKLFTSCFETNQLASETQWKIKKNNLFQKSATMWTPASLPHCAGTCCVSRKTAHKSCCLNFRILQQK